MKQYRLTNHAYFNLSINLSQKELSVIIDSLGVDYFQLKQKLLKFSTASSKEKLKDSPRK